MSKVRGGLGTIADHLCRLFEQHGGELRRHAKVGAHRGRRRCRQGRRPRRRRGRDRSGRGLQPRPDRDVHPAARRRRPPRGLRPAGRAPSTTEPPTSRPTSPCDGLPEYRAPYEALNGIDLRAQRDLLRHGRADAAGLRRVRARPGARVPELQPADPLARRPEPGSRGHARGEQLRLLPADRCRPRGTGPAARRDGGADRGQDRLGRAELPRPDRAPAELPRLHLRADVRMHRRGLLPRPARSPSSWARSVPGPRGWPDNPVPVEGLYLCGAGCHGGPGVTFIPGYNCGYAVLDDRHRATGCSAAGAP